MPLTLASLLPDYKASLHDAASVFKGTPAGPGDPPDPAADPDADFKRHLMTAVRAIGADGKRSCTKLGSLSLVAGHSIYAAVPEDMLVPKASDWGIGTMPVWKQPAGALPIVRLTQQGDDQVLALMPPPNAEQICAFGSDYRYYYLATPVLTDAGSTLKETDRDLVILRAMVEAARELVNRNLHKPITLSPGSGSYPSNQTPASWYQMLLAEYRTAA